MKLVANVFTLFFMKERFDNDALNRSSESKCSIESSPRSAAGSSPRAGSCGGHSIIAQSVQVKSVDQDVVETSVPYNNAPAKFDDDNSDDDAADHLELYVQKQQLLKQILSSSEGNPGKEHAETVSIGVDTSGLNVREAGWLWSPNSRAKDRESREQEMNERIEYYRRNRCALSPSRSPSPSRIANSSGEHVSLRENPTKKARVPPSKQAAEKRKAAAAAANLASVNSTAANVKAHILVEQKKLEKCIIKLTNLKDMRDKHKTRLRELKVKKRMERQQMQGSNESVFERSSVSMKLTVLSARNLPEMKRQKHSADPFVELWVKSAAHVGEEDPSMQIVDGMSMQRHTTTIKWAMLFPLWEESFDFTIPCDMGADGTVAISDDCLRIVLRDAVKSDIAINEAANIQSIIGECFLNFDTLLDQKVHTFWLPVVDTVVATPELHHLYRSRHKIPGDCALKVETRLLYSKEILLRNKISESDKQISNLSTFVDACSNELLELAYGWEQMQQKQQKLNSLTMQPAKLQPKRKQSPVRERSEVPDNVLRPKSFEDFMGSQHAHSSSPTVALISGQAKGTSPQVRLEHRGAEDMLLLARSNSSIEIDAGDVILPVSKRGLTPADKVNIACGPVTSRDQSAFTANPAVPFSGETTTSISFDDLSSGKNRSPTTHAADKEASLAAEQSGRDSRSPSHPPNMSIFRGAGGGRVRNIDAYFAHSTTE